MLDDLEYRISRLRYSDLEFETLIEREEFRKYYVGDDSGYFVQDFVEYLINELKKERKKNE